VRSSAVECLLWEQEVAGSIPAAPITWFWGPPLVEGCPSQVSRGLPRNGNLNEESPKLHRRMCESVGYDNSLIVGRHSRPAWRVDRVV
jgi:hypothetical protein